MPSKEQEKIDDAFTIMITTAILQGFTAGVAFLILFRSRQIRLALVKLLLFFLVVSSLLQVGSRILYYYAIYNHYNGSVTLGDKLFHANACFTGVWGLLFGLVNWIYPFKLWDLSKRMQLMKNKRNPDSSCAVQVFFYSGIIVTAIGLGLVGWNAWFYQSQAATAAYFNIASMPQIVAVFLLFDGIRRISDVLKDEPNVLSNQQAMRLHLFTFCLFGVTLSWLMISSSLFFISFFSNPTTETVSYYFVVASQFVSVLLLLYIFNGLVEKEREKSTQEPVDDPFSDEQNDSSDEVEDQNSLQAEQPEEKSFSPPKRTNSFKNKLCKSDSALLRSVADFEAND